MRTLMEGVRSITAERHPDQLRVTAGSLETLSSGKDKA